MDFLEAYSDDVAINDTDNSPEEIERKEAIILTRYIAYNVIAPIILSMGLLGNILTIFILNHPTFKGVMFNFYLALAVFDSLSLFCSISGIFHIIHQATSSYSLAVWYSYFENLFINAFMGASVLIVVCITFDRYMSVRHPQKFKVVHTNQFCVVGIICSCTVSFIIWLPSCFIKKPTLAQECEALADKDKYASMYVACKSISPSKSELYDVYKWIREILMAFLPIVIVIILNSFLLKYFFEKHRSGSVSSRSSSKPRRIAVSNARRVGDKSLSSLLQAIILCLLITLLPSGVFNAMHSDKILHDVKFEIFRALAYNLELLNHALNFYLYVIMSKPVQSALPFVFNNMKERLMGRKHQNSELRISHSFPRFSKHTINPEEQSIEKEDSKFSQFSHSSNLSHEEKLENQQLCSETTTAQHHIPMANTHVHSTQNCKGNFHLNSTKI